MTLPFHTNGRALQLTPPCMTLYFWGYHRWFLVACMAWGGLKSFCTSDSSTVCHAMATIRYLQEERKGVNWLAFSAQAKQIMLIYGKHYLSANNFMVHLTNTVILKTLNYDDQSMQRWSHDWSLVHFSEGSLQMTDPLLRWFLTWFFERP